MDLFRLKNETKATHLFLSHFWDKENSLQVLTMLFHHNINIIKILILKEENESQKSF